MLTTRPTLTLHSLLELFRQHELHTGRYPVSVSLTQEQYNDLRADRDTPPHIVFVNYGKTVLLDGVVLEVNRQTAPSTPVRFNAVPAPASPFDPLD